MGRDADRPLPFAPRSRSTTILIARIVAASASVTVLTTTIDFRPVTYSFGAWYRF